MTRNLILIAIVAGLVLVLAIFGPAACTSLFTAKQEARVAKGQAGAAVESGAEAMNTVSNVAASDRAADQVGKDGLDAIRKAPEGERGDAALAASCGLRLNKHKQRCAALRKADPAKPARTD